MIDDWHRAAGLRRGLLALLAGGTLAGCCAKPHWYEIFDEGNNRVRSLPAKYANRKLKTGYLDDRTCRDLCGGGVEDCHVADVKISGAKASRVAVCHYAGGERCWGDGIGRMPSGRRPAGLADTPGSSRLVELARLEAASVVAFERLADELARHGAPPDLSRRARTAAADERRHARAVARLAGIEVPAVEVAWPGPRSLFDLALENAIEGCVNETFGALLAWHQAAHAHDPHARRVFARIAPDETRHGALAWAIHRWVRPHLTPDQQARLEAAMGTAVAALGPPGAGDIDLGLPDPPSWRRLAEGFAQALA